MSLSTYTLSNNYTFDISEQLLLRDLLYVFQGIDGEYITYNNNKQLYEIRCEIPSSTKLLIEKLCDIGWIYKKIKNLISESEKDTTLGQINNSFCSIIEDELNEYYRLIAILEAQVNYDILTMTNSMVNNSKINDINSRLTLRKLYFYIYFI